MGYYTQLVIEVYVKKDKIQEFKKAVKRLMKELEGDDDHWFWYYSDISVDEDGTISFEDYHRKVYDENKFAEFLAEFVEIQEARFVWD